VFCRVASEKTKTNVAHYLFCLKVGVCTTAQAIFAELNQFIVEHSLQFALDELSVITDGAAAMQDSANGLVRKIKNVSIGCCFN